MKEYKILSDRHFVEIERQMNEYAAQGWKVIFFSRGQESDDHYVFDHHAALLERDKPE